MARKSTDIFTGIEIGSSTIKVVIGEFGHDDTLRIAGLAEVASVKVLKGEIVDNNIVHEQLMQALGNAERQAGLDINEVYLAVNCGNIASVNNLGTSLASGPDQTITERDVVNALENAQACVLPPDKRILHSIDRRYLVDGTREVFDAVNQVGRKLSVDVHIILGQYNSIENLCRLVERTLGYPAADVAFSGLAAAYGVLSSEEMEAGALVVDIGAGTTQYVLFHGIGVYHSGQLPVGTDHVANDLAIGLGIPLIKARKIVEGLADHDASAIMNPDGRSRTVRLQLPGLGTRMVPTSTIEAVVELRLKELFSVIHSDLMRNNALPRIASGIVLVGGGAMIEGVGELAKRVFNMPVRIGCPRKVSSLNDLANSPKYVTPVGLLRWGKLVKTIAGVKPPLLEQIGHEMKDYNRKFWGALRTALRW